MDTYKTFNMRFLSGSPGAGIWSSLKSSEVESPAIMTIEAEDLQFST
jgi:hypothetical protein